MKFKKHIFLEVTLKYPILLLFILLSLNCFALGTLKVESVKALPENELQLDKYDADGKLAPLLMIKTNLESIQFQNVSRPTKHAPIYDKMHGYWKCYLNVSQRSLEIGAPGYETVQVNLLNDYRIDAKEKRCYELVLSNFPEHEKIPFAIISDPADAEKWVDGEKLGSSQNQQIAIGEHQLELRKDGYKTLKAVLQVSKDNVAAQYKLEQAEPVKITIKSIPSEAQIFIDNIPEGTTNKQPYKYPGVYHLRLIKGGYDTVEDTITVTETGLNTFSYNLVKVSVTLNLTVIPSDAIVNIDNQPYNNTSLDLAPGTHKLEVGKPGYDTETRQITLEKGKDISLNISLIQQMGKLMFTVEPMEASVSLNTGQKWDGSNHIDLPVGTYTVTAILNGYMKKETSFTVEKGKDTKIDLRMVRGSSSNVKSNANADREMVYVVGGTFTMGDTAGGEEDDEIPIHQVTLSSFSIGKYEVTQKQWKEVMGDNPSNFKSDNLPVEQVSWNDCVEFCNKLSQKEGLTPSYNGNGADISCEWNANGYRLPTEAEWEYAAKGGNQSGSYNYSGSDDLGSVAWFADNASSTTHQVGQKQANELGLYDMSGNVWEWCWDWYDESYYNKNHASNPRGADMGSYRVLRGGSWGFSVNLCRISYRSGSGPDGRFSYNGFRLVRNPQ